LKFFTGRGHEKVEPARERQGLHYVLNDYGLRCHVDTTCDTTQRATPRNSGQPRAREPAYLSRFCNLRQPLETGVGGLWLRRARVRVPSVTLLDESWAVLLLVLHTEVLHPKILLQLSPATKPGRERSGKLPNASSRCDRPPLDHGVVADDCQFVGKVGNWASMDRHYL